MSAAPKLLKPILEPGTFVDYFRALHGVDPFPWQRRLAAQVVGSGLWPETIELPTGSGKTAVIDIAVFALALDAQKPPAERKAPRRIFFAIDRRIVVDATEIRARLIAQRLSEARYGILARVATLLRGLADDDVPLHVSKMRGGVYRDSGWAPNPQQPTICVTTVDQLGSRLLYRGYGLRPQAWPIHAGLIAHDSLIVLDEVHISRPFEQTLTAVQRYGTWAKQPLARTLQFMRMSATAKSSSKPFTLSREDLRHPVLGRRLTAPKLTRCEKIAKDRDEMIAVICAEAPKMLSAIRWVIVVVVNRLVTARTIFEQLRQNVDYDTVLLTGRVRPFERDQLIEEILPRVRAGRDRSVKQRPLIVVTTQCIEVGADFDFDAMITECAPLDSLRQRLGRVDRLGDLKETVILVFANKADLKNDLIYGEVTAATWKWLNGQQPKTKPRLIDLGTAVQARFLLEEVEALCAPTKEAPILLPAHCDLFAQTNPIPAADPEPALFLHGELAPPDVQIVWRADLTLDDPKSWATTVELMPPKREEALAVPISAARAFLLGSAPSDVADIGGLRATVDEPANGNTVDLPALRWRGDTSEAIRANALMPGDTIVVPASYGGCDGYGWHPQYKGTVRDIADTVTTQRRGGAPILRIHTNLGGGAGLRAVLDAIEADEPDSTVRSAIISLLAAMTSDNVIDETRRQLAGQLAAGGIKWTAYGEGLLVESLATIKLDTDEDITACEGRRITLAHHSDGVRDYARAFANALGLPLDLADDLGLAGWGHDVGKADPRCQVWFYGSELEALDGELLAKSGMPRRMWGASRLQSGYPQGYRHECESVVLISSNTELLAQAHDPELVLYLICTHHGFCRPFAPSVADSAPVTVDLQHGHYRLCASSNHGLDRVDSAVAERFWSLLRKYGWWGLAYLEAILRLADWRQSVEEQRE